MKDNDANAIKNHPAFLAYRGANIRFNNEETGEQRDKELDEINNKSEEDAEFKNK